MFRTQKCMKMRNYLVLAFILLGGLFFMNFKTTVSEPSGSDAVAYEVPADVQQLIDNSCYGCHNSDSKNLKGKKKLSFDKMADLKIFKQIGKLEAISDVLTEGDMPPKKFLQKMPDAKMSTEEIALMGNWASDLAKKMTHSIE